MKIYCWVSCYCKWKEFYWQSKYQMHLHMGSGSIGVPQAFIINQILWSKYRELSSKVSMLCTVPFFFFFFEHREGSCKSHTALQTKRPFFPPWNKTEVNGWFKKILPLEGSGESLEDRQKHIQSLAISHATGIGKCIGCREAFVWVRIPINFFHSFPISPAFLFFWDCLSLCRQFI